ncbi:hypothetical protein CspHIS471_0600050 [Cutaneotrichosporon sp. HIS471]|nr:hypothetical protein CspHIS471_0600050 [Cutaneotrichosporon sp. HIS471]
MMRNALADIEDVVGDAERAADHRAWANDIARRIHQLCWNEADGRFYEVSETGVQWKVDSVAGFWPLIAGIATPAQAAKLAAAIRDPAKYWTDMVVPALARDQPQFDPKADYWKGGVWAPSTFMTIKGLQAAGNTALARAVSERYLAGVRDVFDYSGTVFELYAPMAQSAAFIKASYTGYKTHALRSVVLPGITLNGTHVSPGTDEYGSALNAGGGSDHLGKDAFVGWTGLWPITVLLEHIIGIQADSPRGAIQWDLQRTDRHGINNLNLGVTGVLSLVADARASASAHTRICISGQVSKVVKVNIAVGGKTVQQVLQPGQVSVCANTGTLPAA